MASISKQQCIISCCFIHPPNGWISKTKPRHTRLFPQVLNHHPYSNPGKVIHHHLCLFSSKLLRVCYISLTSSSQLLGVCYINITLSSQPLVIFGVFHYLINLWFEWTNTYAFLCHLIEQLLNTESFHTPNFPSLVLPSNLFSNLGFTWWKIPLV